LDLFHGFDHFCDPQLCPQNDRCNIVCGAPEYANACLTSCGGDPCSTNCAAIDAFYGFGRFCNPTLCPQNDHCNIVCGAPEYANACLTACGGDPCSTNCAVIDAFYGFGRFCNPILCPDNADCNLFCGAEDYASVCLTSCGGDPCSAGCATADWAYGFEHFCDDVDCPQNADCNLICGGDPCASGCPDECAFFCGNSACLPSCGGDPCSDLCAAAVGASLQSLDSTFCSPSLCPENDQCNILCGGDPCSSGCPDECAFFCGNSACLPSCGGDPCSNLCAAALGASFQSLDSTFCNPFLCTTNNQCNIFCGGDPCALGCPDACTILCPHNLNCQPVCGGNPDNFGCPDQDCTTNPCQDECDYPECYLQCAQYNSCACAGNDPCNAACGDPCAVGCPAANSCTCNPCGATCQPECNEACPQYNLCTCLGTNPCECDPCGAGCPAPGCMRGLQPGDLAVDARAPSNLAGDHLFGWNSLMVRFGGDASGVTAAQFATAVTGGVQPFVLTSVPTGADVQLQLTSRIPPGERTTVEHTPTDSSTCLAFMPGDVNGNGSVNTVDGFALRTMLNNVPATVPAPYKVDLDHSGTPTAEDVIMWLNIVNGAGALDPWLGKTLPASCPVVAPPTPRPVEVPPNGTR